MRTGNHPVVRTLRLKARVVLPGNDAIALGITFMKHLSRQILAFQVAIDLAGLPQSPDEAEMTALIEQHSLRPLVAEELPLNEVAKAHQRLDTGHGTGKIVLRIER